MSNYVYEATMTAPDPVDESPKPPKKTGTIIRLVILGLFTVIGVLTAVLTLPDYIVKRGFWLALWEAFGGCGLMLLTGVVIWGLFKWIAFMGPKSLGWANRFYNNWIPLTVLGVFVRACLWLIILVVPCSIYTFLMSPLTALTMHLAEAGIGFFSAMLLFILGVIAVIVAGFVDICKLRQLPPLETAKKLLNKENNDNSEPKPE